MMSISRGNLGRYLGNYLSRSYVNLAPGRKNTATWTVPAHPGKKSPHGLDGVTAVTILSGLPTHPPSRHSLSTLSHRNWRSPCLSPD